MRVLTIGLVLLLLPQFAAIGLGDGGQQGDAPDDIGSSMSIVPGLYQGNLTEGDSDFYQILVTDVILWVNTSFIQTYPSLVLDLTIYNSSQNVIDYYWGLIENNHSSSQVFSGSSTAYIEVESTSGAGNYTLEIGTSPLSIPSPDDAGSGGDAGHNESTSIDVNPGVHTGWLGTGFDEIDGYHLSAVAADQWLNIRVEGALGMELDLDLWNDTDLIDDLYEPKQVGEVGYITSTGPTDYYVFITSRHLVGHYSLIIEVLTPPIENDADMGFDAPWQHDTSSRIAGDSTYAGHLAPQLGDSKDTYVLEETTPATAFVNISGFTGEITLALTGILGYGGPSVTGTSPLSAERFYSSGAMGITVSRTIGHGPYVMEIGVAQLDTAQDDAGSGLDAGPGDPVDLDLGVFTAEIGGYMDSEDNFLISADADIQIIIVETPPESVLNVTVVRSGDIVSRVEGDGQLTLEAYLPGTGELQIDLVAGTGGLYTIEHLEEGHDDWGSGRDAGTNSDEVEITNGNRTGYAGSGDYSDLLAISVMAGTEVNVVLTLGDPDHDFSLGIALDDGGLIAPYEYGELQEDGTITLNFVPEADERLFLVVAALNGGQYYLSVEGVEETAERSSSFSATSLTVLILIAGVGIPLVIAAGIAIVIRRKRKKPRSKDQGGDVPAMSRNYE